MQRKKIGRPSKGVRRAVLYRFPPRLHEAIRAEAARRGMTANDFVGEVLAAETGVAYELEPRSAVEQVS